VKLSSTNSTPSSAVTFSIVVATSFVLSYRVLSMRIDCSSNLGAYISVVSASLLRLHGKMYKKMDGTTGENEEDTIYIENLITMCSYRRKLTISLLTEV